MNSFWTPVLAIIGAVASLVAILDYCGVKPGKPWPRVLSQNVKLGLMLLLVLLTVGLSVRSFYLARRPRIVEKIVDRPVSVPCPLTSEGPKTINTRAPTFPQKRLEQQQGSVRGNVSGDKNAQVGSLTQGAGSVAQIGGENNSATVNNLTTRPDPIIHWEQHQFGASESETRPGVLVTIWTDGPMDLPAFVAKCDRPCGTVDAAIRTGLSQAGYFSGQPNVSNVEGFQLLTPTTLLANTKITWKIRSKDKDPISVQILERFPPDKVPAANDKTFQPE